MRKIVFTIGLTVFITLKAFVQFSPGVLALRDVNMIDGISNTVAEHYTILIRDTKIEVVGPVNSIRIPEAAVTINCSGKYIIPGLIDTHVHLLSDVSGTDYRARAERDSKAMLLSGITSVRDMAGDARALSSLSRDALVGDIDAPDIYYTSLFAGPGFFRDPRTHDASRGGVAGAMLYMRGVTDSTDLRMAVAESRGTGATGIKLYAQLSGPLAAKITAEAHRQGMPVWSHADLTIASPLEVINAGVNSISHAGMIIRWRPERNNAIPDEWKLPDRDSVFWDGQFNSLPVMNYIAAMKVNRTILDATLLIEKEFMQNASGSANSRAIRSARYELGRRFTRLALESGIPVCTGTDVDENRFVQREIKTLVRDAGFTPMEAIISATRNGAMAIGIENRTGTIEKGKDADLVLLNANPVDDINNLDRVELVIKKGKLYNAK